MRLIAPTMPLLAMTFALVQPAHGFCSVFDERPCVPSFCSVFDPEPCLPEFDAPLGDQLRLTIDSRAANESSDESESAAKSGRRLNTIRDMFTALRRCWMPPDRARARAGMSISIRFALKRNGEMIAKPRVTFITPDAPQEAREAYEDAVSAALERCIPLPLTAGLGGAVAGRPISVRFIENRTL
jgi:hypothetical protein